MGILLGLTAALCWGSADFFARYATRLVGTYRTLFFMQFFGFACLSVYVLLSGTWRHLFLDVGWQTWVWTLLAIFLNIISSLALYRAFEVGVLTIVSPIAASYAAITVLLAVLVGEVISQIHGVGIAASLVGVVLAATPIPWKLGTKALSIPRTPHTSRLANGIGLAILASFGYGVAFWLFGFRVTPVLGGVVPVWLVRLITPCVLLIFAPITRQSISIPHGRVWWYLAGVGILDTAAFVAATVGYTTAQVSIVSVLASLFSAVTVLLAWIFLHDRLQWNQWFGVGIIFVGVALVNL